MISINSDKNSANLHDGARHLTPEGVLHSAEVAVDAARNFTNDSLDKAGLAVRDARANLSASTEQLADKAQELARKGIDAASRTSAPLARLDAITRARNALMGELAPSSGGLIEPWIERSWQRCLASGKRPGCLLPRAASQGQWCRDGGTES